MESNWGLWLMSAFYLLAGINHFVNPRFYLSIIPPFLPCPKWINWTSGAAEVILAVAILFNEIRSEAAWGIIALLVAIFPANIYHFMKGLRKKKMVLILALRLPIQGLLIWWAYGYV